MPSFATDSGVNEKSPSCLTTHLICPKLAARSSAKLVDRAPQFPPNDSKATNQSKPALFNYENNNTTLCEQPTDHKPTATHITTMRTQPPRTHISLYLDLAGSSLL